MSKATMNFESALHETQKLDLFKAIGLTTKITEFCLSFRLNSCIPAHIWVLLVLSLKQWVCVSRFDMMLWDQAMIFL